LLSVLRDAGSLRKVAVGVSFSTSYAEDDVAAIADGPS
jgi:hypothetical protein